MNRTARPNDIDSVTNANDESRETWEQRGDNQKPTNDRKVFRFAEALGKQFREVVKALTHRTDAPQPTARRKRTEDTGRSFRLTARQTIRQTVIRVPSAAHAAIEFLSDTLDWLNLWDDNAAIEHQVCDDLQQAEEHTLSLHL